MQYGAVLLIVEVATLCFILAAGKLFLSGLWSLPD